MGNRKNKGYQRQYDRYGRKLCYPEGDNKSLEQVELSCDNNTLIKDSDKECHKLHSDDWDELEDCCSSCLGNKHFAKKYYEHSFMDHSYDEIMSNMR